MPRNLELEIVYEQTRLERLREEVRVLELRRELYHNKTQTTPSSETTKEDPSKAEQASLEMQGPATKEIRDAVYLFRKYKLTQTQLRTLMGLAGFAGKEYTINGAVLAALKRKNLSREPGVLTDAGVEVAKCLRVLYRG